MGGDGQNAHATMTPLLWVQVVAIGVLAMAFFGILGRLGEWLLVPLIVLVIAFGIAAAFLSTPSGPAPEMCGSGRFEWEC